METPPGAWARTQRLARLFEVPASGRDDTWRLALFADVLDAPLAQDTPPILQGPDGFPYLALHTAPGGEAAEPVSLRGLLELALAQGLGAALNPTAEEAEYVFTLGDLAWCHMSGSLEAPEPDGPASHAAARQHPDFLPAGEQVLLGAPSEALLPERLRARLRHYFQKRLGQAPPRLFLMVRPTEGESLVFRLPGGEAEAREVLMAIGWHLPRHYRLAALPPGSPWDAHFVDL